MNDGDNGRRLMPIPGVFYGGGCSYMACRGLMMSGIEDVLLITHGPVGCAYYAGINGYRGTRAEGDGGSGGPNAPGVPGGETRPGGEARPRHAGRTFVTHMDQADIVFGGEGKLAAAIDEAVHLYRPRALAVCATCPVGLIGDDIERVCEEASARHGIDVLPLSCEGFKSLPGWLHGGTQILDHWVGTQSRPHGPFPLHYMSESFEGRRGRVLRGLLERIGYDVVCSLMGATTYDDIARSHEARLVVLDTGKGIDAVPRLYQQRYGAGFMRVHLTGLGNIAASLRAMAAFFGDEGLAARTEEVLAGELSRVEPVQQMWRARFEGTCAAVFEDIFRSDDYATLSGELGMDVIMVAQDYGAETYTDQGFCVHVPVAVADRLDAGLRVRLGLAVGERPAGETGVPAEGPAGGEFAFAEGPADEGGVASVAPAAPAPTEVAALPGCPHVLCPGRDARWLRTTLGRAQVAELLDAARPQLAFSGVEERFGYAGATIRCEQFLSDERGCDYVGFDGLDRYARDVAMAADLSHWFNERPAWVEGSVR